MPGKTDKKLPNASHVKDLFLLFAIPVGIALLAAAIIYIPRVLANPSYDFVYSLCDNYDCQNDYFVDANGRIIREEVQSPDRKTTATLRYYEAHNDATKSLTLAEAQTYHLNTSSKSPDGYTLSREETGDGFLFWGSYNDGWYLKNGAKGKKIALSNNGRYYPSNIKFLGWVTK